MIRKTKYRLYLNKIIRNSKKKKFFFTNYYRNIFFLLMIKFKNIIG